MHKIVVLRYFYASSYILFSILLPLILFISFLFFFFCIFDSFSVDRLILNIYLSFYFRSCLLSGCSCFSLYFLLVLPFADVFKSETWQSEFFASIPEALQPMASLVKSTVLASRADGTVSFLPRRF